jgi:tRNA-(ms[2]io[6]A)-hydroxylase
VGGPLASGEDRGVGLADDLPLRSTTSPSWAAGVLTDPVALLDDHAHLERKAGVNALAMLARIPPSFPSAEDVGAWTSTLASVAKDETEHLALVLRHLGRRGGSLSRIHANPYAAALHARIRAGAGEVVDRLLVAAAIEARSCERFEVLAAAAADAELRALYRGLCASERGHFRAFTALAERVDPTGAPARWTWWLDEEAAILASQRPGPRMHSGEASGSVSSTSGSGASGRSPR